MNRDLEHSLISLEIEELEELRQMIHQDVIFLQEHGLIDYSLLLAIESITNFSSLIDQSIV
jgi:hypothetical protein